MAGATTQRRLTEFSHGAGCGCKLGPGQLADVLARMAPVSHPDLLVGSETGDDAAVWRLDEHRALVLTTDFFTPLVDDARLWGRIAATNAVSDVYAMGGRPLLALNLVAWSSAELSNQLLADVLAGAAEVAAEGGWVIVGGHSVDDPEPKFGLAVVGEVAPDRVLTNAGLRPGDELVLTKPIGVGTITTAIKLGRAPAAASDAAVASMVRTNARAAEVAVDHGATGATDVTGFGLLGHLAKMVHASGVGATVEAAAVPLLPHAYELAADGVVPGGSRRNLEWVQDRLDADGVDPILVTLLADAQTSGGLLFGVEPGRGDDAVAALCSSGHDAAVVGRVAADPSRITIS